MKRADELVERAEAQADVYVSALMVEAERTGVGAVAAEPHEGGAAGRRMELSETGGADGFTLLPVCLVLGRKRPGSRPVSLRAKRDGRRHPLLWNAPALIVGQMRNLDVAINPGGAVPS